MKKIMLFVLVVSMLLSLVTISYADSDDIPAEWAKSFVNSAMDKGLVPIELQCDYRQAITRAEFCALATRVYEYIVGEEIADRKSFDDTDDVNVQKMAAVGIVNGTGSNCFSPDTKLTREQAAAILCNLADALGNTFEDAKPVFFDNDLIADWAVPFVGKVQKNGIMKGGTGNPPAFQPKHGYSRQDSITTLMNLLKKLENKFEEIQVQYSRDFSILTDAYFTGKYNIKSDVTGNEYFEGKITFKGSKYTNMANSYHLDQFVYLEYPECREQLVEAVNSGEISCIKYNNSVYLYDVNVIQFLRHNYNETYYFDDRRNADIHYTEIELKSIVPVPPQTIVEYEEELPTLSPGTVITDWCDIYSNTTDKTYEQASLTKKSTKYTNMAESYFWDEFFFTEFPQHKYGIKQAVNNGEISGIVHEGKVWLDAVNMIQYFRQYDITFYRTSRDYVYTEYDAWIEL